MSCSMVRPRGGTPSLVRPRGLAVAGHRHVPRRRSLTASAHLSLTVESDRLVAFGDRMESDAVELVWGQTVRVGVAGMRLRLVGLTNAGRAEALGGAGNCAPSPHAPAAEEGTPGVRRSPPGSGWDG